MKLITEEEYKKKLEYLQLVNEHKKRKRELRAEKYKYFPKLRLPSTSKLILAGVFLMCFEVLAFSQYAMIVLGDASALYALIGIPAALIPVCLGYYSKAKAENTVGGIKYDSVVNNSTTNEETVG